MKIPWPYSLLGTDVICRIIWIPPQPEPWTEWPGRHIVFWTHRLLSHQQGVPERVACVFVFLWIITTVLYSLRCVKADYLHEWGPETTLFLKTVLWGEVVGCIVLGSHPSCQITIQLTVFPEVAVMSSDAIVGAYGSGSALECVCLHTDC